MIGRLSLGVGKIQHWRYEQVELVAACPTSQSGPRYGQASVHWEGTVGVLPAQYFGVKRSVLPPVQFFLSSDLGMVSTLKDYNILPLDRDFTA